MNFDDIVVKPVEKKYVQTDWSAEEQSFKTNHPAFLEKIKSVNVLQEPLYEYQPDPTPEEKNSEKNLKNQQEVRTLAVESDIVRGPNCGSSSLQPPQPAQLELRVSTDDIFDVSPSKPNISASSVSDDPFDLGPAPSPIPASNNEAAKPADKKPTTKLQQPSAPPTQATPAVQKPVEEVKSAASSPVKQAEPLCVPAKSEDVLEGFNFQKFEEVRQTAYRMYQRLPNVDLEAIMAELPNLGVTIIRDRYSIADDPIQLAQKMFEIQSKRDHLYDLTVYLTPLVTAMEHACDFLTKVAVDCSTASSREKRLAQVKMVTMDFWDRYAEIDSTNKSVQTTFKRLADDYEMVSRVVTLLQIKLKINEIARGESMFDEKKTPVVRQAVVAPPEPAPVTVPTPKPPSKPLTESGDELFERQMSQPLAPKSPAPNVSSTERFVPKQVKSNTAPGIVEDF
jgi:hypothetical protein